MKTDRQMAQIYALAFVNETTSKGARLVVAENRKDFLDWLAERDAQKEEEILRRMADEIQSELQSELEKHTLKISKEQFSRMNYLIGYLTASADQAGRRSQP